MNRFLFILALTGILIQSFSKIYILLDFEINQAYIAQNLCIKKAEPDNCCKGQCYLNEQLEEEEEKEKSQSRSLKDKEEIQYFERLYSFFLHRFPIMEIYTPYKTFAPGGVERLIFQPPEI